MISVLFANLATTIVWVLDEALTIYSFIVIGSALLSWVNPDPYNPIVRFLKQITEPVYYQIRKKIPFVVVGGFDLSPIVLLIIIRVSQHLIIGTLQGWIKQAGIISNY